MTRSTYGIKILSEHLKSKGHIIHHATTMSVIELKKYINLFLIPYPDKELSFQEEQEYLDYGYITVFAEFVKKGDIIFIADPDEEDKNNWVIAEITK